MHFSLTSNELPEKVMTGTLWLWDLRYVSFKQFCTMFLSVFKQSCASSCIVQISGASADDHMSSLLFHLFILETRLLRRALECPRQ